MKKHLIYIAGVVVVLLAAISLFSCGHSADSISQRVILKQFNKQLEAFAQNEVYIPIQLGTFECNNDDTRLIMRKMKEANLLDYSVKRYAWWEKEKKSVRESYKVKRETWWYTYYDTEYRWVNKTEYNFEDHYVVSLSLTNKGKRIAVEDLPEPEEFVDEDMLQPEVDPSKYAWKTADLSEEWPYIPNPFLEPEKEETVEAVEDSAPAEDEVIADVCEVDEEPEDDGVERIEKQQYLDYLNVEESTEPTFLKACGYEAVKARNIQLFEREGVRCARAEVIVETVDVTDAGRILGDFENGVRVLQEVEFSFFEDKGWVLNSIFDEFDFDE